MRAAIEAWPSFESRVETAPSPKLSKITASPVAPKWRRWGGLLLCPAQAQLQPFTLPPDKPATMCLCT